MTAAALNHIDKTTGIQMYVQQLYTASAVDVYDIDQSPLPMLQWTDMIFRKAPQKVRELADRYDTVVLPQYAVMPRIDPRDYDASFVVALHDLYEYFRTHDTFLGRLPPEHGLDNLRHVDGVVCNSVTTETVLTHTVFHNLGDTEVTTVPPGVDTDQFYPVSEQPQSPVPETYLLYVGAFNKRKNVSFLFDMLSRFNGFELVLAGNVHSSERRQEMLAAARRVGVADRVTLTGRVDVDELRRLYSNAAAYVYPARRDGYGLTPVEAAACGTVPVMHENIPSSSHVPDSAVTVDEFDPDRWADAVRTAESRGVDEGWCPRTPGQVGTEFARFLEKVRRD